VVFNQAKTCHQLEAKKILQNANLEMEYATGGRKWLMMLLWVTM
jgi:hypothetical protein